jgi:hypothetical protein
MIPQSTFLILAPIRAGQLDGLRALLASMNQAPGHADPANSLVPFGRFERLHVARFVILELHTADDIREYGLPSHEWTPSLAFLGDCDGDSEGFLAELAAYAGPGLKRIFSFCAGFAEEDELRAWMQAHSIRPQANYVNWLGRTVRQVREEAALHRSLAACLEKIVAEVGRENYRAIRQKLLNHVEIAKAENRLTLTPPEPTPLGWLLGNWLHKLGMPLLFLLLSPLLLVAAPLLAWRLRLLERSDPDIAIRPDREHIRTLSVLEDHDVTNQFNVLGDVKPGLFRLLLLRTGLLLLDYSARHIYKRGFLTRVTTIHFARWVLVDGNRSLFFASNYDGSLESYMDDFINKVAWGLNLVFSNGVGYPATRWLLKGGAEQEQRFKYVLRRHQLPSAVWYKAYPGLTAFDLWRNSLIRQGVEVRQPDEAAVRAWLSLI